MSYFLWLGLDNFYLGEIYSESGEYEIAIDCYQKAIFFLDQSKSFNCWIHLSEIALAKSKVLRKKQIINLDTLYNHVSKNRLRTIDGIMRRYVGEILLNIDNQKIADVEDWIKKAIELDDRNRNLFSLSADYAFYAKLFQRKGDILTAKEYFAKAIDILIDCGADGWVDKYNSDLSKL